ncbi:MAG: aminotransferase class IV [Pseudomonadota bacterium]|nr:aminotransferase class IV [Pseudomonadota bacterium]
MPRQTQIPSVKLQRPPFVFMNGRITPWDEATIHVASEAALRAASVFEGIKGYWRHDGREFALLALREHFDRLRRSAQLLHLPFSMSYEEFNEACASLTKKLLTNGRDLWLRTTLFAIEGHWGEGTVTDLVITGYQLDQKRPEPIDVGISTWQRPGDAALPARIKSTANYQIGRLARIEGRRQGFADMILLNPWGRVAEASGSCVVLTRDGALITPSPTEGCLESITVEIIRKLSSTLGIAFERRPVDRTELYVADEMCLAGTLAELIPVRAVESCRLPQQAPLIERIADEFWDGVRGVRTHAAISLTPV